MDSVDLESVLIEAGVAEAGALELAAERAARESRPLAAVLVEERVVAEDALADALASAVGTVVIDVAQGTLDLDSVALVPEGVARAHLLIPVSLDPSDETLRVAFANPLDADAVEAVRAHTGFGVQPLVATVSGVRVAIDREYRPSEMRELMTQRPGPRSEMPAEITRRVESRWGPREGGPPISTLPMHRLEGEATIEQRIEALLLALIESGTLTRADYVQALRRLMRGRD